MNTDKTENQTIEKSDNELIAEVMNCNDILVVALFDGWVFDPERWIPPNVWIEKNIDGTNRTIQVRRPDKTFVSTFPSLKYDTSWDWLMPVWYKFKAFNLWDFKTKKDGQAYMRHLRRINHAIICLGPSPCPAFEELVKAISWYNSQKVKTDTEV